MITFEVEQTDEEFERDFLKAIEHDEQEENKWIP